LEIRNIKRVTFIVIVLLTSIMSYGQRDAFFPCVDVSESIPQIKEYNKNLEKVFISTFKQGFILRFIAKPSFDPEYAFQIHQLCDSAFVIEALKMNTNIWDTKKTDSINYYCRAIDTKLLQVIESLFKVLINNAQNKSAFMAGVDGVEYNFLYNSDKGIKCVQAQSLYTNSTLSEVLEVIDDLMLYAQNEDYDASLIEEKIKSLCMRIGC